MYAIRSYYAILRMGAFLTGLLVVAVAAPGLVLTVAFVGMGFYFVLLSLEVGITYRWTVQGGEVR